MTFIPMPNGMQLCFDFGQASQLWQFCLSLRKSSGPPLDSDLILVANAAADWWTNHMKVNLSDALTLRQVRVTDMTAQGAPQYILTDGTTGQSSADPLTTGSAAVVSARTAKRGRSYRGRVYLGGLTTDVVQTAADMSGAAASTFGAAFAQLQTELDALGYDTVVASRQHNGVVTNPAELNEVIAWVVDTHFDSQRRRLAGRGT